MSPLTMIKEAMWISSGLLILLFIATICIIALLRLILTVLMLQKLATTKIDIQCVRLPSLPATPDPTITGGRVTPDTS